jgi:hypothetical protein
VLYVTNSGRGFGNKTITQLRKRFPNLYISAPYVDADFDQDAAFEKINESFKELQNYQTYQPKNEKNMQEMLNMVQQYRLEISPKWFEKTWLHILMHLEGKARHCNDAIEKSLLVKAFYDATQLLKPWVPKTASWTHLMTHAYDLWELVYSAEIWYALRRADFNATHLAFAQQQLAICVGVEQKQGHRKEFIGLQELADELAAELAQ